MTAEFEVTGVTSYYANPDINNSKLLPLKVASVNFICCGIGFVKMAEMIEDLGNMVL
jgi:hypothetical protein